MTGVIIAVIAIFAVAAVYISQKNQTALSTQPGVGGYAIWFSLKPGATTITYGENQYMVTDVLTYESRKHYVCRRLVLTGIKGTADAILLIYREPNYNCWAEILSTPLLSPPAPTRRNLVASERLEYLSDDEVGYYEYKRFSVPQGSVGEYLLSEKFSDGPWTVRKGRAIEIKRLQVTSA